VFRAAVLSIVLALAVGQNATLLCRVWCDLQAAAASGCHHGFDIMDGDQIVLPNYYWRERTDAWLHRVGLRDFAEAHPHELSGGMQQRTAIARAFAVDPEILLMDEPFSGLDELTARTMRELLLEIWLETRKTVIFVTHNCFEACFLADRIVVFTPRPGRIRKGVTVELPRPRNYEDSRLFELSVSVTHYVTGKQVS